MLRNSKYQCKNLISLKHSVRARHKSRLWNIKNPRGVQNSRCESVNVSLGVPPATSVFSTLPRARGPLNILEESWEGTVDSPSNLGKNTVKFLRELQEKLTTVRT